MSDSDNGHPDASQARQDAIGDELASLPDPLQVVALKWRRAVEQHGRSAGLRHALAEFVADLFLAAQQLAARGVPETPDPAPSERVADQTIKGTGL